MLRTSRSRSPVTRRTALSIRTREPTSQDHATAPFAGGYISTQAARCPFPGDTNRSPHLHSTAEGKIAPSIDEYRKAGEAMRERSSEEQRRRIAENEAVLRELSELEPKVRGLAIQPYLPRRNDLTVEEQIAVIHGGATPAQYETTREMLLEQQRQEIIKNTSPISPVFPASPNVTETKFISAEQDDSLEYDDFPQLNAKYGLPPAPNFSQNLTPTIKSSPEQPATASDNSSKATKSAPIPTKSPSSERHDRYYHNPRPQCAGACPIQWPHNSGPYLQNGHIPRVWNSRWGYSDPPRRIWEAFVRLEQGRGSDWDEVEVYGFAQSHFWRGGRDGGLSGSWL